jgi:hypothetical protein
VSDMHSMELEPRELCTPVHVYGTCSITKQNMSKSFSASTRTTNVTASWHTLMYCATDKHTSVHIHQHVKLKKETHHSLPPMLQYALPSKRTMPLTWSSSTCGYPRCHKSSCYSASVKANNVAQHYVRIPRPLCSAPPSNDCLHRETHLHLQDY